MTAPPSVERAALLETLTVAAGKTRPITWLRVELLPPLLWVNGDSAAECVPVVVALLRKFSGDLGKAPLAAAREAWNEASRGEFIRALYYQWSIAKCPSAHKWVLDAVAEWGDEATAHMLALEIRTLLSAKTPKNQKVVARLEVLGRIGGTAALSFIEQFGSSSRFPSVRAAAVEILEAEAARRGCSVDELGDDLTPAFGLDRQGRATLDFGTRRFFVTALPDFSLRIVDEEGKPRKSLPKSTAKDDQAKALAATLLRNELRDGLADQGRHQARRLEAAMLSKRAWPFTRWRSLFLDHPLLRLLALGVVWAYRSDARASARFFRVAEDWTLADANDESWQSPGDGEVVIPHPLEMAEPDREAWRTLLADYKITQPFDQLDRATYRPTDEDRDAGESCRFGGVIIEEIAMRRRLTAAGWMAGTIPGERRMQTYGRTFPRGDATAVLLFFVSQYGEWNGRYREPSKVTLASLFFVRGRRAGDAEWSFRAGDVLPVDATDPLVFSEATREIGQLAASSRERDPDWKQTLRRGY